MNIAADRRPPVSWVRVLGRGCLAALLAWSWGDAAAQGEPYEAVVVLPTVEVRSGAGRAYYEVGVLSEGDRVTVEAELFGWYKIQCPPDVFCFVERKDVNVRGDGSRGVVETDNTAVNAAHANDDPSDSYRNLARLNAGDTVEIVDTIKNAYKIRPPADAFVFLPPKSLRPATAADMPQPMEPTTTVPAEAPAPEPALAVERTAEPAPRPAPEPIAVEPPAPAPLPPSNPTKPEPNPPVIEAEFPELVVVESFDDPGVGAAALLNDPDVDVPRPDVAIDSPASHEKLRAVEVAMLPFFSLPVDRQPIAKMTRGYADASEIQGLSANDQTLIRTRLAELERNRGLAEAMLEADAAVAEANADTGAAPATATTIDATPETTADATPQPEAAAPVAQAIDPGPEPTSTPASDEPADADAATPAVPTTGYDAVGILTASTVHTGNNQPELYRLLDPTGRRTVAYLEPGDPIDRVQMIGRLVGIVGESAYDPTTRLNLIQPTQIDILSPR